MAENVEKDKTKIRISDLLKSHPEGLTITDIMEKTGLARHTVLARLHGLIGGNMVGVRKINMAKLHSWKSYHDEGQVEQGERAKLVELEEKHIRKKPKEAVKELIHKELANKESISKELIHKKHVEKHVDQSAANAKKMPESEKQSEEHEEHKVFDIASIKADIEAELKEGKIKKSEAEILKQRAPILHTLKNSVHKQDKPVKEHIKTGVPGFDELFDKGIPKGYSVLIAGGAGSGKTILCLQTLFNKANEGKKCYYMSFEESEDRLIGHMGEFGWDAKELIKKGKLKVQRMNPFDITRNVDALLAKQKGELLIDIDPVILPKEFKPDFVVIDSLTAIASAFIGKEDSYRIYIEQLFRFFEKLGSTNLLITETNQIPVIFSQSGVEEFLADGVVVFYNFKKGDVREKGIEVLKMRGENHKKKIVAMQITDRGIVVYPDQEVFSDM